VVAGLRYVDIDTDRARVRTTLMVPVTSRLSLGVEYNPLADDVNPLANWVAVTETELRPAMILGTSSDRIGTPSGQAYYATFSKDLKPHLGLPVAPYVGASYGTYDDTLEPIGGLNIRYTKRLSSMHLHDGHRAHHILNCSLGERAPTLGLLWVSNKHLGVSFSMAIPF
jgi:hypothetical protein